MQLRISLMGALKAKSPAGGTVDLPAGGTIDDVLRFLDVDPAQVQIVMVNGKPSPDRSRTLEEDDELTVLPPVGGG